MGFLKGLPGFALVLALLLGLAFLGHVTILSQLGLPRYADLLPMSYVVNFLMAFGIYALLYLLREKLKFQIGFLFMGGSFIKFIFFFVLFYPTYMADGDMSRSEFAAFFIPYAICLLAETIYVARMLRNLEDKDS